MQIFFLLTNRSVRHLACVQLLQQYIFSLGYKNSLLLFLGVHEKYNALAPSLSSPLPPPPDLGKIFCLAGESLQQIQLHPAGKLGGKLFRIFGREGNYLGYLVLWETI